MKPKATFLSERIANGKMKAQTILKFRDIVVSALARFVWNMQGNTQVETNHQEGQIVAYTYPGIQGKALRKVLQGELSTRTIRVFPHQPYIAGIEEGCSIQIAKYRETILHIGFELDVSRLVEIAILGVLSRIIGTRTDGTNGKGTKAIGTSDVELFAIWSHRLIAIRPKDSFNRASKLSSVNEM